MGFFTYLREDQNELLTATITPSTASSGYSLANLTALPIAKAFRFTGDTSENFQIDLGSAKAIDLCALVNHNLSSGATITLNGGSSANPDGSQFTVVIPYREFDAFKFLSSAETWQYWKLIITDAANVDGYIEIGYLMLGDATVLTFAFEYDWEMSNHYQNLEQQTEFGVSHVSELFQVHAIQLLFSGMLKSEAVVVQTIIKELKRNLNPLFLIPDWEDTDGFFGRIQSDSVRVRGRREEISVKFISDSRGNKIMA